MIKGIAHVCLHASDLAAAENFYCKVLGLQKRFDFIRQGKLIGFYLQVANQMFIEIFQSDVSPATGSIRHLCLETDDLDSLIAQVKARGGAIKAKTMGCDHSWQAWIKAPDGVDIEFHQYTPQSCQTTGQTCQTNW